MRRAPSIVALLSALAACSILGVVLAGELRRSTPDVAPRAAIDAAATERAGERDARFAAQDRSFDAVFDPAMVRDRVRWSMQGSPATLDLTVVNATPDADLAATARACARAQGDAARVQCYVFANTEAYEFKNITAEMQLEQKTAIVNLCWAAMASNERAGGAIDVSDMRDAPQTWAAQQCPDGWSGR